MKLTDIKRQIVIVCGKLCSGKGHFCSTAFPNYHHISVSSVVKGLAKTAVRSELGQTSHLDQQIADELIKEIKKYPNVIVDGIRQKSIIERLQQEFGRQIVDTIWLEVPEDTLRARFNKRVDAKDDLGFERALASDAALGLTDVEQLVKRTGRIVNHEDQT
jgi:predicted kinase